MTRTDLLFDQLKKKFELMGFSSTDPVINNVLGILSNAPKSTVEQINVLESKIENLLNLDEETLKKRLNLRREKKIKEEEMAKYVEANKEELKVAEEDRKQDQEQNQDLFILTANGNGERIIEREEEERDLQDRQRQIAEKSLRVLEAMEKARDAIEKGKEIPEMDLSYLKDLTPQEFAKQMAVFKTFGLQPVALGRDRQVREDPEREVTLETVTKDDIEQGDVAFAIQFDKLKDPNWRKMAEKSKAFFEQKGLKTKYIPETTIEDDLINAVAGTDKTQQAGQRKVEDDEGR